MPCAKSESFWPEWLLTVAAFGVAYGQQGPRSKSSYMEVEINEPFSETFARLSLRWLNSEEPTLSGR